MGVWRYHPGSFTDMRISKHRPIVTLEYLAEQQRRLVA